MKKVLIPSLAIVLAVAGSAFTQIKPQASNTLLHWFDAQTGDYLGQDIKANMECPGAGLVCREGYEQISPDEQPVGARVDFTDKAVN
jgi:hypothetical protein